MDTVESLLSQFAERLRTVVRQEIYRELSQMSISELMSEVTMSSPPPPPRVTGRPTPQQTLNLVVNYLRQRPAARSEDISGALGIPKTELPKAIAHGLSSGVLTRRGRGRATEYLLSS